jgi:hypothetical protein
MKKNVIGAIGARSLMIVVIILLIIGGGVGFYFAQTALADYSKAVTQTVADAASTGKDVQALKKLELDLGDLKDVIKKTNSVTATTAEYQNKVILDINTYAQIAHLGVTNFNFGVTPATGASSSSVTITLKSPILYTDLLKFLRLIETNLPKMQISGVNLSRVDGDTRSVNTETITLEAFTK